MKRLMLCATLVLIGACSTKHDVAKVEMTEEAFVQNCLKEHNNDIQACKTKLVQKRIGFECSTTREKTTSSRIKKKSCTTSADREKIAKNSDLFVRDLVKNIRAVQTPRGEF
jgi:hypothetical protein